MFGIEATVETKLDESFSNKLSIEICSTSLIPVNILIELIDINTIKNE